MIRPATPGDVAEIHELVCDLAEYEKLRDTVVSTPADFQEALFGNSPKAEALVADVPNHDASEGTPRLAGMAIFFSTFSTFTGKSGLWLEDVFVRPEFRGQGVGKAFLTEILAIARKRKCARAEWSVLDWNTPAIEFYEALGATVMPDWRITRVAL